MNQFNLDRFIPRSYQMPLYEAFTTHKHKRYLIIWPRRAGKDICALNLVVSAALDRVSTYFLVYPTFSMGRRILWDAIDIDGRKILNHYVPDEIVESRNEMQMRIRLRNGSQIQILGSDDVDKTLVGTNCAGIVFSEYALQDPKAWLYSIPILKASAGWALFISTPRGKNNFWDLYNVAQENPDWFCQRLTIEETKHISVAEIEKDIESGQMSRELSRQEYYCDFSAMGVSGSYYGPYLDKLYQTGQICKVMYEPYLPVHTAWDIGFNDPTVIIFFQIFANQIRIIDFYQNNKQGLDHYAKLVHSKPYTYGKHLGPFDIAVHDLSTGVSRYRMMQELGITFVRYMDGVPNIQDGIEQVRRSLPKFWIDETIGQPIVRALENYKEDSNEKLQTFKGRPVHDNFSHIADAIRYLCVGLPKVSTSADPLALEKRYNEAYYGVESNLPPIFQQNGGAQRY